MSVQVGGSTYFETDTVDDPAQGETVGFRNYIIGEKLRSGPPQAAAALADQAATRPWPGTYRSTKS